MPPYLVLARKYRPTTFSDVVGQNHVVKTLKNSIVSGRVGHAFLFCGVRGVGKTTVARILAKSLNCTGRPEQDADPCNKCVSCAEITGGYSVDVIEIDGASNTSVENIREINENIKYPPVGSSYKIIIIDEVHMISINAFNALLKTLEEPPPHAKFIFATTESHKVPATINSRCQRFNFRTISSSDISIGIGKILSLEGISAEPDSLDVIAREARGSFRDALSLLDQVIAFSDGQITTDQVASILGIDGRDSLSQLVELVIARDSAKVLALLSKLFQKGYDPDQFVIDLIQYLRNLIVMATIKDESNISAILDVSQSEYDDMKKIVSHCSAMELQNFFTLLIKTEGEIKKSLNPWVALEMMLLRVANSPQLIDLRTIIGKLDSLEKTLKLTGAAIAVSGSKPGPSSGASRESRTTVRPSPGPAMLAPDQTAPKSPETKSQDACVTEKAISRPTGSASDAWMELKSHIRGHGHESSLALMEHAELVTYGPRLVEIGFTKTVYKEQFEENLKNKPELKNIFDDFFGKVKVKTLMLSQETSLKDQKPYDSVVDGQTDQHRAIRSEAMENPIIRQALKEFEDSAIEEIRIIAGK